MWAKGLFRPVHYPLVLQRLGVTGGSGRGKEVAWAGKGLSRGSDSSQKLAVDRPRAEMLDDSLLPRGFTIDRRKFPELTSSPFPPHHLMLSNKDDS